MNIRRGLWRLWLVLTVAWLGFAIWTTPDLQTCLFRIGSGQWCDHWTTHDYLAAVGVLFGGPVALLVLGCAVFWITSGFKEPKPTYRAPSQRTDDP
jgi:hypothetical protein